MYFYYTLSANKEMADDDVGARHLVCALVELPSLLLAVTTMNRFGRRSSSATFMFLAGTMAFPVIWLRGN